MKILHILKQLLHILKVGLQKLQILKVGLQILKVKSDREQPTYAKFSVSKHSFHINFSVSKHFSVISYHKTMKCVIQNRAISWLTENTYLRLAERERISTR